MDYPWLISYQENLKHAYVVACLHLARYYLAAQDYTRAIGRLKLIETVDPFSEEIHGLTMTAYAKQGNLPAVKKQYQTLVSIFKKELGLSPSPAIRDLYLKLIG